MPFVKCEFCGEVTKKLPSRLKSNKHHFCSYGCWYAFKRKYGQGLFDKKQLAKEYLQEQKSTTVIAKKYGHSPSAVWRYLKRFGIPARSHSQSVHIKMKNPSIEINGETKDFLDGLLLSDGSMSMRNKLTAYFKITQTKRREEWVLALSHFLKSKGINCYLREEVQNGFQGIHFDTGKYEELVEFRKRWYKNGKKIIPRDINLINPIVLANWYLGDGCLCEREYINFGTNGFPWGDVEWLRKQLEQIYGWKITHTNANTLNLRRESSKKFIEVVKPFVPKCFYYKINIKP